MITILTVTYSLIAAIIGAGFASGQEMLIYFVLFKKYGIWGIVVTVIAFALFVYVVLSTCIRNKESDYDGFLKIFTNATTRRIVKTITLVFSFAVYGAMISAAGEIIYDFFGISRSIGTLICAILSAIGFIIIGDRIFTFNGVLGIVLVLIITFSALYMLCYREYHVFSAQIVSATNSAFIYSGYNLVSLTPVLVTLSKRLKSKTDAIAVSCGVGSLSGIIMLLIFGLLSIYASKINLGELPMLTLARRQNHSFAMLYSFVLTCAILTTMISAGGGLCEALNIKNNPLKTGLLSASAYLLSSFGFSNLIDTAYRLCGIVGLFICIITIIVCIRQKLNNKIRF